MSTHSSTKSRVKRKRGLTIAELLVSIAIMLIITTVVALNSKQFGAGATLKNIVNDLSLSLRQAQIYGVSVKQFNADPLQTYNINNFNSGYGVHFDLSASPIGDVASYLFFVDMESSPVSAQHPNGMYGGGNMSCPPFGNTTTLECLDKTTFSQGYTVSSLCTIDSSSNKVCSNTQLDVTFYRPATEAKIIADQNGVLMNKACIEVTSPDGKQNSVVVYTTGQISVRNVSCATFL
ncbi:MAG: prepilin-type N-terminal cleavage/methylation domain-containing protein [Patescibacteria group bacterium]